MVSNQVFRMKVGNGSLCKSLHKQAPVKQQKASFSRCRKPATWWRACPPYHRNFGKRLVKSPKLYFLARQRRAKVFWRPDRRYHPD